MSTAKVRRCAYLPCRTEFVPTNPEHQYCCHGHANKARVSRKRAKEWDPEQAAICPSRYKRMFGSYEAAVIHLAQSGLKNVYPYRCRCGSIHVGHSKYLKAHERASWDFRIAVCKEKMFNYGPDKPCRHKFVRNGECCVCEDVVLPLAG